MFLSTAGAESTASTDPTVAALHIVTTQVAAHIPIYINFTQLKATVEILGLFTPRIFWYKLFCFTLSCEVFCKAGVFGDFFYNLLSWGDDELWVFVCYQIALILWIMHSYLKREGESSIKNKRLFVPAREAFPFTITILYSVPHFLAIIQRKLSFLIFQYFLGVFISKYLWHWR